MDTIKFKKIIKNLLENKSFKEIKKKYYIEVYDVWIVLTLQRSSFSRSYYLNYKLFYKKIHSKNDIFKLTTGDLSGRIYSKNCKTNSYLIDLDNWNDDYLIVIEKEIDDLIDILKSGGIKKFLKLNPNAIHAAPLRVKAHLEKMIKS